MNEEIKFNWIDKLKYKTLHILGILLSAEYRRRWWRSEPRGGKNEIWKQRQRCCASN